MVANECTLSRMISVPAGPILGQIIMLRLGSSQDWTGECRPEKQRSDDAGGKTGEKIRLKYNHRDKSDKLEGESGVQRRKWNTFHGGETS